VHVPATILTLALFTALFILLRIRWPHLSHKFKRLTVLLAIASIALIAIASISRISTTSDHINVAACWCAVLSYIFFVILFTRLRPTWLTTLIAIVVILPLLSASAILPLAAIFSNRSHNIKLIGDNLVSDLVPIDAVTAGASGADLTIYRRASWAPFLRRKYQGIRYFNTQCDTSSAHAILQPDLTHLLMVCPAKPGRLPQEGRSAIVRLYSRWR
jgi:hypothetical protein